jgi:hypothetical protein
MRLNNDQTVNDGKETHTIREVYSEALEVIGTFLLKT